MAPSTCQPTGGLCALNPDGSLRWQDDYTYSTYGTPVIGLDGTVYACRDHGLSAFSPDGTLRWFHATYSYCRTPAVGSDGTVYCGAGETLFALSPDDSLLWTYAAGGYIYSSPVIRADGVICFVADYHDVQALNPDGSEKWTWTSPGNRSLRDGLAVGEDGSVFAWSDYGVHAIDADGVSKWQFDGELGSSPVIGPDGALFVGGSDNSALYALDPDGEVQWTLGADDWTFDYGQGLAVSADGVIYHATQRDSFYIVNPDGSVRAVVPTGSRAVGYPTIAQDGSAYFGSRDGCLYALNGTAPLAGGQWPKSGCDIRNSGRAPASDGSARRTR
jgi:outer membrane protein assembly factor BamB